MQTFRFSDIISLLKHNRHVEIDENPSQAEKGWTQYEAKHRIHTASYPFSIIYLDSEITQTAMAQLRSRVSAKPETHIVFTASLAKKFDIHNIFSGHRNIWSIPEYFRSFIRDELKEYAKNLASDRPIHYVNPTVQVPAGFSRKLPNPILSWLTDPRDQTISEGAIAILLAAPGQGKTYTCTHIVSEIASKNQFVPLFVDSSQWGGMTLDDLESIHKTILHSLRHYSAAINWAEGHEEDFISLSFRTHLFCLVFDGFDEYILRKSGNIGPMEVLETLSCLAKESGARILVTSRTSFWETGIPEHEVEQYLKTTGSLIYRLMPFNSDVALNYFRGRIADSTRAQKAVELFKSLQNASKSDDFVGRGFVLSLIADLAIQGGDLVHTADQSANTLDWLVEALCRREELRQQLPLSAKEQVETFCRIARERIEGIALGDEDLFVLLPDDNRFDKSASRRSCAEKLRSHPLLAFDSKSNTWGFHQEQIELLFLAIWILTLARPEELKRFALCAQENTSRRQDLVHVLVSRISRISEDSIESLVSSASKLIQDLSAPSIYDSSSGQPTEGMRISGELALEVVDRVAHQGSEHKDRSAALVLITGSKVQGLAFYGSFFRGFDLSKLDFESCVFSDVTFINCDFGSVFGRNRLTGGRFVRCANVGLCDFRAAALDNEAQKAIRIEALKAGQQKYTEDDLRSDIQHVLKPFVVRGGLQVKTIATNGLGRGPIADSRHCDEILTELRSNILYSHRISGMIDGGFAIREDAIEAVKFYALNNVFTGALAETYERLRAKILGSSGRR